MQRRAGFTLVKLLAVIAGIALLAVVVFIVLFPTRAKGNDAGVRSNIDIVVTQAASYLSNSTTGYGALMSEGSGTACPTPGTAGSSVFNDPVIEKAIAAAVADSAGGEALCYASSTSYAIAVSRPAAVVPTTSYFWCADSTGAKCGDDGDNGDGQTPIARGACVPCTVNR